MNKDLDEEIEKIIERKVQERLKEQKKELKKEILEKTQQTKSRRKSKRKISRRSFLKKIGAGVLGLGAASLIPNTAALDIKDEWGLEVYQNGTEYLDVNNSGVQITNTNLNLNNNNIESIASAVANDLEAKNSFTDPSGTNHTGKMAEVSQLYTDSEAVSAGQSAGFTDMGDWDTNGRDFNVHGQRALVGYNDGALHIGFGGDFTEVNIDSTPMYLGGNRVATRSWVENNSSSLNNVYRSNFYTEMESSITEVVKKPFLLGSLVSSKQDLNTVVYSSSIMGELASDQNAMNAVSQSPKMMDAVANETAATEIFAEKSAMQEILTSLTSKPRFWNRNATSGGDNPGKVWYDTSAESYLRANIDIRSYGDYSVLTLETVSSIDLSNYNNLKFDWIIEASDDSSPDQNSPRVKVLTGSDEVFSFKDDNGSYTARTYDGITSIDISNKSAGEKIKVKCDSGGSYRTPYARASIRNMWLE